MRSSFFEFHVATSGLFTARGNLHVTSHNIANAETVGYSRQYAEQRTNRPMTFFDGRGMVGTGSEVYGIAQYRDFYLDKKYWSERSVLGEYSSKKTQLDIIETVFNDLNSSGLTSCFNDFFDKIQSLTENSGSSTYRTNLIQSTDTMISMIQLQANSLKKQQQDINGELKAVVETVNSIGKQIQSLNRQIATYEQDGSLANDLRDKRALLVDELSIYVNVEVVETEMNEDYAAGKYPSPDDRGKSDKRFTVLINGSEFVNHYDMAALEVRPRTTKNNEMDEEGLYDIYFSSGIKFNMYHPNLSGTLKGLIDLRDGNNQYTTINGTLYDTAYKGIPYYMNKLNDLVRTFAKAINEGLDKDGNPIPGVTGHLDSSALMHPAYPEGVLYFTYDDGNNIQKTGRIEDYSKINVFNFTINPEIMDNPLLIAAADTSSIRGIGNAISRAAQDAEEAYKDIKTGDLGDLLTKTDSLADTLWNLCDNPTPTKIEATHLTAAQRAYDSAKNSETEAKAVLDALKKIKALCTESKLNITDAGQIDINELYDLDELSADEKKALEDAFKEIKDAGKDLNDVNLADLQKAINAAQKIYDAAKTSAVDAKNALNKISTAANMTADNSAAYKAAVNAAIAAAKTFADNGSAAAALKAYNDNNADITKVIGDGNNQIGDIIKKMEDAAKAVEDMGKLLVEYGLETADESDNTGLLSLLKIKDYKGLFKEGRLSDFINSISTELGIDKKQAELFENNYTDVTVTINNQRLAVSGVDINEEMINMIKYQQLFQASSKLINVIDGIYDIIVNRLGSW